VATDALRYSTLIRWDLALQRAVGSLARERRDSNLLQEFDVAERLPCQILNFKKEIHFFLAFQDLKIIIIQTSGTARGTSLEWPFPCPESHVM